MIRIINIRLICKVIGLLLFVECGFMLLSSLLSYAYAEDVFFSFLPSAFITLGFALILFFYGWNCDRYLGKREGYLIVTIAWFSFSLFGSLPYYISGYISSFTDAFFETNSGFTTTGATILKNVERLPKGLLFWRSLTQWLGGMGIVVFTVAILPLFKAGGMQLFMAESTGPTLVKIHPRIAEMAQRLWYVYIFLTFLEVILLYLGGMELFDSVCHSLATLSSGGFSTKNASVAYWNSSYIHYVIIIFMFFSGVNFTLLYYLFQGKLKRFWDDEELKWYISINLILSVFIAVWLYYSGYANPEKCFRDSLFQVISILTTTGFATTDYMLWHPLLWTLLLYIMISGGSAGSTNGGAKMVRVVIAMKNIRNEFRRFIHPNAVISVKMNKNVVPPQIVTNVLVFLFVYILLIITSVVILIGTGLPFDEAFGATVSSVGNVGPGIGDLGPASTYADISISAKWFLSFLMIVGRLELFTVLLIFTPYFWKE